MIARFSCLALVVVLDGTGCSDGDEPTACTKLGCAPVMSRSVATVDDAQLLSNATFEVCIEKRCTTGRLPPVGQTTTANGAFEVRCTVQPMSASTPKVAVELQVAQQQELTGLADGDVYSFAVTLEDGALLAGSTWIATYTETDPNGSQCEPHCYYATFSPAM